MEDHINTTLEKLTMLEVDQDVAEVLQYIDSNRNDKIIKKMSFPRLVIGKHIFEQEQVQEPSKLLIRLLTAVPNFLKNIGKVDWSVDKNTGMQQVIVESFCFWINPKVASMAGKGKPTSNETEHKPEKEPKDRDVSASPSTPKSSKVLPESKLALSGDDKIDLVKKILDAKVAFNNSIAWDMIVSVMHLKSKETVPKFLKIVNNARINGTATFELLSFCIDDSELRNNFDETILYHALLMGNLPSGLIDKFVFDAKRPTSTEFREKCRQVLHKKAWTVAQGKNEEPCNWADLLMTEIHKETTEVPPFINFKNYMRDLLPELGGEPSTKCRIPREYGASRIVEAITQFEQGELNTDQYRERCWTVLAQRPELKENVLRQLKSTEEQSFWNEIDVHKILHNEIPIFFESVLSENINAAFYSLPNDHRGIITDVNNCDKLTELANILGMKRENVKFVSGSEAEILVGIDAEWSAYRRFNKAALLQIATEQNGIFLLYLDTDNVDYKRDLLKFLWAFFKNNRIIKIGFEFNGDLNVLQRTFPSCKPLYAPAMLISLEKIAKKNKLSSKLNDLCEKFLKKPLNKAEQLSVWNRCLLRPAQRNYAALDAYCLIELFRAMPETLRTDAQQLATEKLAHHAHHLPLFVHDLPDN